MRRMSGFFASAPHPIELENCISITSVPSELEKINSCPLLSKPQASLYISLTHTIHNAYWRNDHASLSAER